MTWLAVVFGIAVLYQGGVLLALIVAWRNPKVPPRRTPAEVGVAFEEVQFQTANQRRLRGWWIPAQDGAPRPLVVLVHGWGRNRERMLAYVPILRCFHVLAFDARHHGLSDDDSYASMPKFSQDIRAAIDYAVAEKPVEDGRVAVLGLSIGGAASIHAASVDERIGAVVTAGAFADPRDAMVMLGRWSFAVRPALPLAFRFMEWRIGMRFTEFAPEAVIDRARARFLLVHGEDDPIVPVSHARRLHAAAAGRAELWVMPGRGHSDTHLEPGFDERINRFLRAEP